MTAPRRSPAIATAIPAAHGPPAIPRRGLRWNIYLAIALGLVLAAGLTGASALLAARNAGTLEQVARTENARAALSDVLGSLANAETGQRGYLLTQDNAYLQPYNRGLNDLPFALAALEASLRNGPGAATSLPLVASLRAVAADKLAELADTLARAMSGDAVGALDIVQSDRGERDMQVIRQLVSDLAAQQQAVLVKQITAVNTGGRLLVLADALGFALLALLACAIAWSAWQAFMTLRATQADLADANDSLEDRVTERTAALTEANEEIQRFAYIVSHDLRAPLVNIMGFTSELEAAATTVAAFVARNAPASAELDPAATRDVVLAANEDIPESLRFIKTSAAKMDRLIGAILKLSREGRRVLTPEPVPMRPLVDGIAASMQHQADERGAVFVPGDLPTIVTDRLVLEQIFSNLMENALKYLQPGRPGRIEVTGRVLGQGGGHSVVYEVRDNGRGIAQRDLERVFELFRRAGDQTVPGEGIGLAHVRALVRRLGGRIDCVSTVGVGSTFRIELPRTPAMPEPTPKQPTQPQPAAKQPAPQQAAPKQSTHEQPSPEQEPAAP